MSSRRILCLLPYVPDPVRVRPYNLVRALVARGNEVTVAAPWETAAERAWLDRLAELGVRPITGRLSRRREVGNLLAAMPSRVPLQSAFCWLPELAAAVRETLSVDRYDVVHVEHLRGSRYGLLARAARRPGGGTVPVVWDSVDCISLLFDRAASAARGWRPRFVARVELRRTRAYEASLLRSFAHTVVVAAQDRESLLALPQPTGRRRGRCSGAAPGSIRDRAALAGRVHVVPNGVDLEYFRPAPGGVVPEAVPTLVALGKMSYHANVAMVLQLVERIMPHVWRRRPDAAVWIVGKDPPAAVRRLATWWPEGSPSAQRGAPPRAVAVTGTVRDAVVYLQEAWVSAAPITYGVGIQNKVLEAMACAVPVVASPAAVSALEVEAGRDCLVASEPEAFARALLELLEDPARRRAVGRCGHEYVRRHHAWGEMASRLESVYDLAAGDGDASGGMAGAPSAPSGR